MSNPSQLARSPRADANHRSAGPSPAARNNLGSAAAQYRPGWSLPGGFYSDPEVYRVDIERVWRRGWLFAAHSCELLKPGDYITLVVDTDSLIVIRGEDGAVRGLHNVCRHRGSLVCPEPAGHALRLVCPYHQWTYGGDGRLLACRGMPEELDKSAFGLRPVHTREVEGLIYVSLAEAPPDFEPAARVLGAAVHPQGLTRAKVAKAMDYRVQANWKLVWENNRECFHCNANHPQYIKANFDHFNSDDTTPRIKSEIGAAVRRGEAKWAAAGLAATHQESGMTRFPDAERNLWYSANRTPLVDGYVSETMDGELCESELCRTFGTIPVATTQSARVSCRQERNAPPSVSSGSFTLTHSRGTTTNWRNSCPSGN